MQDYLCIQTLLWFVSGGQGIKWFTMSCHQWTKQWLWICTRSNWNMCSCTGIALEETSTGEFQRCIPPSWKCQTESCLSGQGYHTTTWLGDFLLSSLSSQLVLSNYYFIHFTDNHLHGKSFSDEADLSKALMDFFPFKTPSLTTRGLPN